MPDKPVLKKPKGSSNNVLSRRLKIVFLVLVVSALCLSLSGLAWQVFGRKSLALPEIFVQSGFSSLMAGREIPSSPVTSQVKTTVSPSSEILQVDQNISPLSFLSQLLQIPQSLFKRIQTWFGSFRLAQILPKKKQQPAPEQNQPLGVVSQEAYALTLKQQQLLQSIDRRLDSTASAEALTEILSLESVFPSQVTQDGDQYQITTDGSGMISQFLPTGVYTLEALPIDAYDITNLPEKITLESQPVTILLGLKPGKGEVFLRSNFSADPSLSPPQPSPAPSGSQQLLVRLFYDKNDDDRLGKDEKFVPWAGITLIFKKLSEQGFGTLLR